MTDNYREKKLVIAAGWFIFQGQEREREKIEKVRKVYDRILSFFLMIHFLVKINQLGTGRKDTRKKKHHPIISIL